MTSSGLASKVWRNPIYFLAFGFGTGLIKKAPGTWGTCAALPIYLLIEPLPLLVYLSVLACALLLGVVICGRVSKELGVNDYSGIVWDEIVGYLITMVGVQPKFVWMLLGFGLFRLFDILKPPPIRWVDQRCQGGWAVMMDDVLAGIAACLVLQLFMWGIKG